MIIYKNIQKTVRELRASCETDDLFEFCDALGIQVIASKLGLRESSIKGFFFFNRQIPTITYNSDLPVFLQKVIIAHETGHAMLHQGAVIRPFHDIVVFDRQSPLEKEANIFAAELLLSDEAVLQSLRKTRDFFKTATSLFVPPELLEMKYRLMMAKYNLPEPPIVSLSSFLAGIDTTYDRKEPNYDVYAIDIFPDGEEDTMTDYPDYEDVDEDHDDNDYDVYPEYDDEGSDGDYGFDVY